MSVYIAMYDSKECYFYV